MRKVLEAVETPMSEDLFKGTFYTGITVKQMVYKDGKNDEFVSFINSIPDDKGKTFLQIVSGNDFYRTYRKERNLIITYTDENGNTEEIITFDISDDDKTRKACLFLSDIINQVDNAILTYETKTKSYVIKQH